MYNIADYISFTRLLETPMHKWRNKDLNLISTAVFRELRICNTNLKFLNYL
jgi:hypothetical protein